MLQVKIAKVVSFFVLDFLHLVVVSIVLVLGDRGKKSHAENHTENIEAASGI